MIAGLIAYVSLFVDCVMLDWLTRAIICLCVCVLLCGCAFDCLSVCLCARLVVCATSFACLFDGLRVCSFVCWFVGLMVLSACLLFGVFVCLSINGCVCLLA